MPPRKVSGEFWRLSLGNRSLEVSLYPPIRSVSTQTKTYGTDRTDSSDTVRLSTTVATNALLERRGAPHALLITKGFKDLLSIGNQARPRIFDLHIKKPSTLYGDVVEVDERVTLVGYTSDPEHASHSVQWTEDGQVARAYGGIGAQNGLGEGGHGSVVQGLSGEAVHVLKKLDQEVVTADLQKLYDQGYRSVAVVLAHS